jgi:8-oxo-dGTP pyrophosphatase MutT (NUDIX family)
MRAAIYNVPVIEARILPALHARLAAALAPPSAALVPLVVDGRRVGELTEARARRLAAFGDVFAADGAGLAFVPALDDASTRTRALERVTRTLAGEGALTAWRDERYEARAGDGLPVAFALERAAARYFGLRTSAVHVNGLVDTGGGAAMWIARRSADKAIDPGLLDNLVGGGIAAGASVAGTLVKEAWEEAGIDAATARGARPAGTLHVRRLQPDGLQHETIHVHDLWLPQDFVPAGQDGEAVEHRLVPLDAMAALLANADGPDVLTGDATLVAVDALLRLGAIDAEETLYPWLSDLCGRGR